MSRAVLSIEQQDQIVEWFRLGETNANIYKMCCDRGWKTSPAKIRQINVSLKTFARKIKSPKYEINIAPGTNERATAYGRLLAVAVALAEQAPTEKDRIAAITAGAKLLELKLDDNYPTPEIFSIDSAVSDN